MKKLLSREYWRSKTTGPNADWFWVGVIYLAACVFFVGKDAVVAVEYLRRDVAELKYVNDFNGGRAIVNTGRERFVIDKEGRPIKGITTIRPNPVKDNFAEVEPGQEFEKGIEKGIKGIRSLATGEWVARYQTVGQFNGGLAVAISDGKPGVIDKTGKWVVEPGPYSTIAPFSNGYARVMRSKDGRYGYIDGSGRLVIQPAFDQALGFNEAGTAPVRTGGRWGVIDRKGEWVGPRRYASIGEYREGLAPFLENGLYGYLDARGQEAIPARFEQAKPFSEGLAAVKEPGWGWGYIDKSGAWVIKRVKGP